MKWILFIVLFLSGCSVQDVKENTDFTPLSDLKGDNEVIESQLCTVPLLTYAPVNLDKTKTLLPLGLMTGSHVTPIDHHYFQNWTNKGINIEVYAPADGVITSIQHMPGAEDGYDYRIIIDHGCGLSSTFIHIGNLPEHLLSIAPELTGKEYADPRVEVVAGEVIGYFEQNVDYNLVNQEVTLTGFAKPDSYKAEPWKIHVPDMYSYFTEEIQTKLYDISLREAEPRSGKIDYDIPGTVLGTWFLEGTNGYAGDSTEVNGYWLGHLSIVYDAYDTDRIIISIGGYNGSDSRQFTVVGNEPNPAEVTTSDGLIMYQLVEYDYFVQTNERWDRTSFASGIYIEEGSNVVGTLLLKLVDDETLQYEIVQDTTSTNYAFGSNSVIYNR